MIEMRRLKNVVIFIQTFCECNFIICTSIFHHFQKNKPFTLVEITCYEEKKNVPKYFINNLQVFSNYRHIIIVHFKEPKSTFFVR